MPVSITRIMFSVSIRGSRIAVSPGSDGAGCLVAHDTKTAAEEVGRADINTYCMALMYS